MFAHYLNTRQDGVTMSKPDNVIVIWGSVAMGKTSITVFKATLQNLCNINPVILKKAVILWFI